jgi:hypothetical protein
MFPITRPPFFLPADPKNFMNFRREKICVVIGFAAEFRRRPKALQVISAIKM